MFWDGVGAVQRYALCLASFAHLIPIRLTVNFSDEILDLQPQNR